MAKIIGGTWTDARGNWAWELDDGSNPLGLTVSLLVTKPDGTITTLVLLDGYVDANITAAGGPQAYINSQVIPAANIAITSTVNAFSPPTTTPSAEMLAMLATLTPEPNVTPPQFSPLA
jgi:hypothetical protein